MVMNAKWGCVAGVVLLNAFAPVALAEFKVADRDGRIEVLDDGKLVFAWRHQALPQPKGGGIFAASAFIHPLCTPSGFGLTRIQPDDHLHHFGLWWPWKMLTLGGRNYNTWEIQQKQGRHVAVKAEVAAATADEVRLKLGNRFEISNDGAVYQPAIDESVDLRFARGGKDSYLLDIDISQQAVEGLAVEITSYRYSGFSWRGPQEWHAGNSTMLTSGGHHRDNANHQPAEWVSVTGKTRDGMATMLIMSAAGPTCGTAERLRVWGSSAEGGTPFANFNPVAKQPLPLTPEHKSVAQRRYRIVVADRAILPAESDKLWKEWQNVAAVHDRR